jgi:hypothetical protein
MSCNTIASVRKFASLLALAAALGASSARAQVFDDFSDNDDTANPAWTHLSGLVGSSGQGWNAAGGQYNLTAPNNGVALGNNGQLGFVGSYAGPSFTTTLVSADFVQPPTGVAYGVAARLDGNNAINALTGYAYAYEPLAAGGLGEMVLYRITGASLTDLGSQQVTLDFGAKDYKFELSVAGDQLRGRVFEIGGGMVAERNAVDATYASGFAGVFGYSAAVAQVPTNFTVDNFRANVPEPATGALLLVGASGMFLVRRFAGKRQTV